MEESLLQLIENANSIEPSVREYALCTLKQHLDEHVEEMMFGFSKLVLDGDDTPRTVKICAIYLKVAIERVLKSQKNKQNAWQSISPDVREVVKSALMKCIMFSDPGIYETAAFPLGIVGYIEVNNTWRSFFNDVIGLLENEDYKDVSPIAVLDLLSYTFMSMPFMKLRDFLDIPKFVNIIIFYIRSKNPELIEAAIRCFAQFYGMHLSTEHHLLREGLPIIMESIAETITMDSKIIEEAFKFFFIFFNCNFGLDDKNLLMVLFQSSQNLVDIGLYEDVANFWTKLAKVERRLKGTKPPMVVSASQNKRVFVSEIVATSLLPAFFSRLSQLTGTEKDHDDFIAITDYFNEIIYIDENVLEGFEIEKTVDSVGSLIAAIMYYALAIKFIYKDNKKYLHRILSEISKFIKISSREVQSAVIYCVVSMVQWSPFVFYESNTKEWLNQFICAALQICPDEALELLYVFTETLHVKVGIFDDCVRRPIILQLYHSITEQNVDKGFYKVLGGLLFVNIGYKEDIEFIKGLLALLGSELPEEELLKICLIFEQCAERFFRYMEIDLANDILDSIYRLYKKTGDIEVLTTLSKLYSGFYNWKPPADWRWIPPISFISDLNEMVAQLGEQDFTKVQILLEYIGAAFVIVSRLDLPEYDDFVNSYDELIQIGLQFLEQENCATTRASLLMLTNIVHGKPSLADELGPMFLGVMRTLSRTQYDKGDESSIKDVSLIYDGLMQLGAELFVNATQGTEMFGNDSLDVILSVQMSAKANVFNHESFIRALLTSLYKITGDPLKARLINVKINRRSVRSLVRVGTTSRSPTLKNASEIILKRLDHL